MSNETPEQIARKYAHSIQPCDFGSTVAIKIFAKVITEERKKAEELQKQLEEAKQVSDVTMKVNVGMSKTVEELQSAKRELIVCLKSYVDQYEDWEKRVNKVIGRQPETGIHIKLAKQLIAKHGDPNEQTKGD